ncbi:MAG: MFS transporter [Oscillatoriales cyanobacterium SM2_2_1]|nr:MFS transporter [Oscillatoriales cyanobacterium SM2_2_1]
MLFWTSLSTQLPVIPLYVQSLGGDTQAVGVVMGAFAIGLLLCRSLLGRLSDQRGRRLVLQIGLVVGLVMPLYYAQVAEVPLLLLGRAVHGISVAAFATGYGALVADLAPLERRASIIGYMSMVNPMGLAVGSTLGGWMEQVLGFSNVFRGAAVLAMLGLLLTLRLPVSRPEWGSRPAGSPSFFEVLWQQRVRTLALVLFMIGMIFGNLSAFLPLAVKNSRLDFNPGLFYLMAAIAGVVMRLATAKLGDRFGRGLFVSAGLCFYVASMVVLFYARTVPEFLIAGSLEGMGAGIALPAIMALIADRSCRNERGQMFGLSWMGFDLGLAVAAPTMGGLIRWIGLAHGFLLMAGLGLAGLILFCTQSNADWRRSLQFAAGRGKDIYALEGTATLGG